MSMIPHRRIALQHLGEAWDLIAPERARETCILVSGIIRRYIENQFRCVAPQSTDEEFLEISLKLNGLLGASQRNQLAELVEHFNFAKAVDWNCSRPDLESMLLSAEQFVRETSGFNRSLQRDRKAASSSESDRSIPSLGFAAIHG